MSLAHTALHPRTVSFESEGSHLSGDLFLPPELAPRARVPAIVVTGSWTTVKEQMAGLYARRLAERGFAALAFDFRHWGTSEGEPRQYESPERKIRDIINAVAYLQSRPEIDAEQIGGLAVCASAGYLAHAVGQGAAVRSIALVAAWLHDAASVAAIYGGQAGVDRRLEAARLARAALEQRGEIRVVPAYDPNDPDAAMFFPLDYYGHPDRGAVPEWTNRFAVMSWADWLGFDGIGSAAAVTVPTLMVHADAAALPDNARRFFAALGGPKHLFWTAGTQTDFYDREPQVGLAVDVAAAHFRHTLGAGANGGTMADRHAIADTITRLLYAVDTRDWPLVRACLAPEVRTDYTSLFGGSARTQSAEELIQGWGALLPGFDATQHLTGPILADVRGHAARATCAVTAIHRIGHEHWTPSGHYEMELARAGDRWTIGAITFKNVLVTGNDTLPQAAQARARQQHGAAHAG